MGSGSRCHYNKFWLVLRLWKLLCLHLCHTVSRYDRLRGRCFAFRIVRDIEKLWCDIEHNMQYNDPAALLQRCLVALNHFEAFDANSEMPPEVC